MKKAGIIIIVVIVLIVAWFLISPAFVTKEVNEESPLDEQDSQIKADNSMLLKESIFQPRAHEVEGKALLIEDSGNLILRFEDFSTINGPDLRIYLSSDLNANDFIDLGEIKATKGNVNYNIPEGTDLEKYNKVLVWCRAFKVLFSYADLSESTIH